MNAIADSLNIAIALEWNHIHPGKNFQDFPDLLRHPVFKIAQEIIQSHTDPKIDPSQKKRLDEFLNQPGERFQHCVKSVNVSARFIQALVRNGDMTQIERNAQLDFLKKTERTAIRAVSDVQIAKIELSKCMDMAVESPKFLESKWLKLLRSLKALAVCQQKSYRHEIELSKKYSRFIQNSIERIFAKPTTQPIQREEVKNLHSIFFYLNDQQQTNYQDILACQFDAVCQAHNELQIHLAGQSDKLESIGQLLHLIETLLDQRPPIEN